MEKFKEKPIVKKLSNIGAFTLLAGVFIPLPFILLYNKFTGADIDRMWAFAIFATSSIISLILIGTANTMSDCEKYTEKFLAHYNAKLLEARNFDTCYDLFHEVKDLVLDENERYMLKFPSKVRRLLDDIELKLNTFKIAHEEHTKMLRKLVDEAKEEING